MFLKIGYFILLFFSFFYFSQIYNNEDTVLIVLTFSLFFSYWMNYFNFFKFALPINYSLLIAFVFFTRNKRDGSCSLVKAKDEMMKHAPKIASAFGLNLDKELYDDLAKSFTGKNK